MDKTIEEKYVRTLTLLEIKTDPRKVFQEAKRFKVLNITKCQAVKNIEDLLHLQDFHQAFEDAEVCFVLVFEIEDSTKDLSEATLLSDTYKTSKPIIVSLETAVGSSGNVIFYKEANEKHLKKWSFSSVAEFQGKTPEESSFNIETLLRDLSSNTGGSFNGKLLTAAIETDPKFSDLGFLERAVAVNNILCIKFLHLFRKFDYGKVCRENQELWKNAAKSCDFQGFQALFDLPFDCDMATFMQAVDSHEIFHPQHSSGNNLLMIASESGNADAVSFLLKCHYDINQEQEMNETAADLAWKHENFHIFVNLLRENSLFPKDFPEKLKKKSRGKLKNVLVFINELTSFHESIQRGRVDQVKSYLNENPTARHAYNTSNQSAAATALRSEQFGIYELLISQGVCLGPHEDMSEILSCQVQSNCHDGRRAMMKKIHIHEMHKKYLKKPFASHLMTLLSSSEVGFDVLDQEKRFYFHYIKDAFEILNEIEEISPVLKLVARSKFIRVVFDFNRESTSHLDATTCQKTKGTSYFKTGYIYVGAKGLLDNSKKYEVLGTLAHELTHYAMQLVYDNSCKPYRQFDIKLHKEFEIIEFVCAFSKTEEQKIFHVFNYSKAHQHAELIVRVPHILAAYRNNREKCEKVIKTFKELFEFYKQKTLVDINEEYPLMLAKREAIELNNWLGVIQPLLDTSITLKVELLDIDLNVKDKVLLIVTNCVKLTVKAIYQQLHRDLNIKVESFFLFARPSQIENANSKNSLLKVFNSCTYPTIVFECDDDAPLGELQSVINSLKASERIIFVTKNLNDDRFQAAKFNMTNIKHSWEDFVNSSQVELWKFKINFQGEQIDLHDLMPFPSKAVDNIPFCDLLGKRLKISYPLNFKEIDFYVERMFTSKTQGELNFDHLTNHAKSTQVVIISDDPGAGKTTTFKTFAQKLKSKFPHCWVAYVDLKQFIDAFEGFNDVMKAHEIAEFFADKIFKLEKFEFELFRQLFTDNRLILLMDGIDEICPDYKEFIIAMLKDIKATTGNQIWISTRPHLAYELSRELKDEIFHLKQFSPREQKDFYRQFYEQRLIPADDIDRYTFGIEKLMSFLTKNRLFWSTITNDINSNPLFMRITAEIYDDDVMQRSTKGKCLTLCNLYLMYERFVEKKFSVWMHKGRLSFSDQMEIHRSSKSITKCHLRMSLERTFNDRKANDLVEEPTLTREQIARVGLMTMNGHELQFIHRTFAEFFVADFLFKQIFFQEDFPTERKPTRREKRRVMRLFVRVLSSDEFQMIRAFLGNAFELIKQKKDPKRFVKLAFRFRRESNRMERDIMLTVAVKDGCVNLTSLILELSSTGQCALTKAVRRNNRDLHNVLMNSLQVHRNNVETVKSLWDSAKTVYTTKDIKRFLSRKDEHGRTLLENIIAFESPEVLKFIFDEFRATHNEQELQIILTLPDINGHNTFERTLKFNKNCKSVRTVWNFYEDVFNKQRIVIIEILSSVMKNCSTILHDAKKNDEKVFEEFCDISRENFLQELLNNTFCSHVDSNKLS